jgi:RNA polymerase sigma-70 factor, ECF subfamily
VNDLADRIAGEIPRLRRYARALLRSDTEADDLVQECVLRGLAKQHLWQEGTDLRAWLFTILHNQFVNNVRRAAREGTSVKISDLDGDTPEFPAQEKRLELRDLDRALCLLPDDQRTVIFLIGPARNSSKRSKAAGRISRSSWRPASPSSRRALIHYSK